MAIVDERKGSGDTDEKRREIVYTHLSSDSDSETGTQVGGEEEGKEGEEEGEGEKEKERKNDANERSVIPVLWIPFL